MLYSYLILAIAALIPAGISILIYVLERNTALGTANNKVKQVGYGIIFGALAVLGTEAGIPMNGAQVNCRDAAVLCAGLLFGGPAGIIAGIIGGVERWIAVAWGVGSFTRVACSVSTVIAGFYAALLRKFMFESKKPGTLIAFAMGVVMEVFHLTMVFITNMGEPQRAMAVVQACTVPMVLANGLSVMIAVFFMERIGRAGQVKQIGQSRISQIIQRWLLVAVLFAFAITSFFVIRLQDTVANTQTDHSLENANQEVVRDIQDASDAYLVTLAYAVRDQMQSMDIKSLAADYMVAEINVVDQNGIITKSTQKNFVGFDMGSGEQSAEFLCLLGDQESYVQAFGPITINPKIKRKYAGVKLEDGFLQIGLDARAVQWDLAQRVQDFTRNKKIGDTGFVLIVDSADNLVSRPVGFDPTLEEQVMRMEMPPEGERTIVTLATEDYYCRRDVQDEYSILALQTVTEAMQTRTISVYVNIFLEILVFALLFGLIYLLIRNVVVNQIKSINTSLSKISGGNLDEVVNVRSNAEFSSLSDDINTTVDTLKRYISEASARIDRELEAAKSIQSSALPVVQPDVTGRGDVDLYAYMDPAKEVGGDFYDFYMNGDKFFNFLIADVSGKGIPAAMFMMRAKTELKNKTEAGMEINDAFYHGNIDLCQGNDAEMFVTAFQGTLNLDTGLVNFANAGHNQPLVRHGNAPYEMVKTKVNFVLAGMEGARYLKQELQLQKGDSIFLYTDGVTEATNAHQELYGNDRLLAIANAKEYASMKEMCEAIRDDIDKFVGEAPQFDDITMVGIRFIGLEDDWVMRFDEAKLDDIPFLTEKAEEELERLGCSMKTITQFSVAIDELYSNIVKFAYPRDKTGYASLTIRKSRESGTVQLIFEDAGRPYNPLTNADPDITLSAEERSIGGLGIYIVRQTMDEVLYRYENDRNIFTIGKKL